MQLPVIMIVPTKSTGISLSRETTELPMEMRELKLPPMMKPIAATNTINDSLLEGTNGRFFITTNRMVITAKPTAVIEDRT